MNSTEMTWEDDDNNRQIRFRVDYTVGNSEVEIVEVVPTQVMFDNTSNSIGVHTLRGRAILAGQINRSGRIETLKTEIAEQAGLLTAV